MLSRLRIFNFRGFEEHELPFGRVSVVVGRNNAGKSTIVEALRLVSIIAARYKNLKFYLPPDWAELPAKLAGVSPSLRNAEINFENLFHRYGNPPAKVIGEFSDGASITVYLAGEDQIHAVIRDSLGKMVSSSSVARQIALPSLNIMPQVTPVQSKEMVLSPDYVRSAMSSRLASLHFRNQILLHYELFPAFQQAVEETWHGVRVEELMQGGRDEPLYLQVRNEDFVADVATMGHGLQMWLQTMWFLTRSTAESTVILDEPDVYMHADLQRRLIRYLRGRFKQIIVATHSIEIMAEVEPDEVLVVERRRSSSTFATSLPAVQRVVRTFGSAQNIQLARLWTSRRVLLLEGKDLKLLKIIQDALFPSSDTPFDAIPNMSIGGWGGWSYALGSSMMIKNALGQEVTCYCILDSDFHTDEAVSERYAEAKAKGVQLHIWSRKEIESFLLVPRAIFSAISTRAKKAKKLSELEVDAKMEEIAAGLQDDAFDALAAELLAEKRQLGAAGANKRAREVIKARIASRGLRQVVSGKEVLLQLSQWAQEQFGANINPYVSGDTVN